MVRVFASLPSLFVVKSQNATSSMSLCLIKITRHSDILEVAFGDLTTKSEGSDAKNTDHFAELDRFVTLVPGF